MDLATIIGIIAALVFTVISIMLSGDLSIYLNAPSAMITFGGTFASVLVHFPLDRYIASIKAMALVFRQVTMDEASVIKKIIELSNIARKEGLLALEEAAEAVDDDFLKKGILLIVDGTDPELVRNILETELVFIQGRHSSIQSFYEKIGEQAPAWGMIGTLIGLINMLNTMEDPSTIGPNMAIAMMTTLYGSLLANTIAIPFAFKMKIRSGDEVLLKEVMIEGLLSIQAGENPRVIEEKLKAFLAPTLRKSLANPVEGAGDE